MESDWLISAISDKKNMTRAAIEELVKQKQTEFPGRSEDAILRMLATENGIIPIKRDFKTGEIKEEINHVNITASVWKKFPKREINLRGGKSTVLNFIISDETGSINVVVWDTNKAESIDKDAKSGSRITLVNCYSKRNKLTGNYELHVGKNTAIKITDGVAQPSHKKEEMRFSSLRDITEDGKLYRAEVFLMRVFTDNTFLTRCKIRNKKVNETCEVHGKEAISKILMISGIVDDGVTSSRATFFDRVADKLLSISKLQDLNMKLEDLSTGMYQLDITCSLNRFGEYTSLNVKDVKSADYATSDSTQK